MQIALDCGPATLWNVAIVHEFSGNLYNRHMNDLIA
jgi:hypothetical protein